MKCAAYAGRDKIRDLYDLTFICNHFFERLSPQTKALIRSAVEYKGIEQFDYLLQNQPDKLINAAKLAEDFLEMYDRLGLLYDKEEKESLLTTAFEDYGDLGQGEDDDEDEWDI